MDSDDSIEDILPEAQVFKTRIDDIWNETLEAYKELNEKSGLSAKDDEATTSDAGPRRSKRPATKAATKAATKSAATSKKSKRGSSPPNEPSMSEEEYMKSLEVMLKKSKKGLSAAAKKRIKEREELTEIENKRVERETAQTLLMAERSQTRMQDKIEFIEDPVKDVKLKFRYEGVIKRIIVSEEECFKTIFKEVAELFHLKASEILLCRGDSNIKLADTPKSLDLKMFEIIEVLPFVPLESKKLLIKLQSNDTRKRTELRLDKLEKLEEIMKSYANLRNLDINDLVFKFDGERIIGSETPVDLDMESGSVIDVTVLTYVPPGPSTEPVNVPPIPRNQMLDIIELD